MLYFIGLGISEGDISLKAIEKLKECEKIYFEKYTSLVKDSYIEKIEKIVNKKFVLLKREELEGNSRIVEEAKNKKIALLVGGESLIATTHHSIVLDLLKNKIPFEIIHSSSAICSAISESFLQVYRFGKITTIPFWREDYKPLSFYDYALKNFKNNLHTIFLLDVKEENNGIRFMKVNEALEILKKAEKERRKGLIKENTKIIVLSSIGEENIKVYGEIQKIEKKNIESFPSIIILPAKLHFMEEEILSFFEV
ncbi:MAG: diphthine synthase [Minisyncoccia bacterium]